jgi:hypothetical protein
MSPSITPSTASQFAFTAGARGPQGISAGDSPDCAVTYFRQPRHRPQDWKGEACKQSALPLPRTFTTGLDPWRLLKGNRTARRVLPFTCNTSAVAVPSGVRSNVTNQSPACDRTSSHPIHPEARRSRRAKARRHSGPTQPLLVRERSPRQFSGTTVLAANNRALFTFKKLCGRAQVVERVV